MHANHITPRSKGGKKIVSYCVPTVTEGNLIYNNYNICDVLKALKMRLL